MYETLKSVIMQILQVEAAEPHPPAGHRPHELLRVERADPSYLRLRLFIWKVYAILWSISIIVASVALYMVDTRLLLAIIPMVIIATFKAATLYVVSRLDYEMRWYVITERSLLIREGVWNVRETTLTFANAQNVRVTQGPVERLFGISNVEVDTAGGGGKVEENGADRHSAVIRGLANPAEVREMILDLLRRHRSAGLGDPDDATGRQSAPPAPALLAEILEEARVMREAAERKRLT